jgi:2,5-diketo-D-gluconate reductase A
MTDNDHMSQASDVPTVGLPGGADMPLVGLGTWKLTGGRAETAVTAALAVGYRHIDTAVMYGNEAEIGSALTASELGRDEVFLTTKIRPSDLGHEPEILRRSLRALRTDYVDLWLVHWPPRSRNQIRQIWNAVRKLRDAGLVKAIGVSNFDLAQIDDLIEATGEGPAVNQVRWSPALYDSEVLVGHKARGIALEGYSALKDSSLAHPVTAEIAAAHDVSPAQVILRWHLEHGITIIPKSERPERLAANLDLFGFTLAQSEVAKLDDLGTG